MFRFFFLLPFAVFCVVIQLSCADVSSKKPAQSQNESLRPDPIFQLVKTDPGFNAYWYQGKAELASYAVEQERYGEMRRAEQVNIFVTEDFSAARQVKLDAPESAGADRVQVLKWNAVRKFVTGIYDYSLMQSVFTPVTGMSTLKSSTSVQDWCGQVYSQINLSDEAYRYRQFSYFEQEGDTDRRLPIALLEDELWTRLRLDPGAIPTGPMKVLPSSWYCRLRHQPMEARQATIEIQKSEQENTLVLQYSEISRTLRIRFQNKFPYVITGWEELDGLKTMSKGVLKSLRKSPYWMEHNNEHLPLRDSLMVRGGY